MECAGKFLMRRLLLCLLLLFMVSSVRPGGAEEKIKLEEVVVTAAKVEEAVEETTSDVIVIKAGEIKKMNIRFVSDVFRDIPEINLVQNGGSGGTATVFLRGADPKHSLVMIDGIKVKSTTTGSFDFSGLNVDDIERIEIVKGPQSTLYGSEAMGGVINIITRKGEGKPKLYSSFEAGSYGTYKPSVSISGGSKQLDYRLTGSYYYTDGFSSAKSGVEKDGYRDAAISGKFGLKPSEKVEFEFSGKYYYDRTELDGFNYVKRQAIDDTNYVQRGNHYMLSGKGKFYIIKNWEQILTLSTVKDALKAKDPDTAGNNYEITTGMGTIDWQHNLYFSDVYVLTGGAEYRNERGRNEGNFDDSVNNRALYLNNKLKLFSENLILNAGLRYDNHETAGSKTTYRVGALYDIKPIDLKIKGSHGTGFRAPSLNELFYPFYGNLTLKPEESTAWDIGFEKGILKDRASVSLTYFEQRYKNLIQTDSATWLAANIARSEIKGVETAAKLKVMDHVNLKAGYTYLNAKDMDTGQRLSRRPEDKYNLGAEFFTKEMSLLASYTFVGKRYDSSVRRNLESYTLVNLSGDYKISKWLTVFARVDNLFNKQYEEAGSYKTPGFSIYGGVKVVTL